MIPSQNAGTLPAVLPGPDVWQRRCCRLTFDRFAPALFFVAIGLAACLMPAQNDTWWHLRAGMEIVETGTIPLRDSFSHTVNGGYWPDHEWLSQVIFYTVFWIGGLPLLTAFAAGVVTITWFIVWRLIPGRPMVRLGLAALALVPVATEWSLRPQIFTLLCLALTARLLVRRSYSPLVPLFLLWANLHGGVMLGVILVTAAAAAAVVAERRLLIRPVVVAGVCGLMTAMTPLGFSVWTEVPASLERLRAYGVHEWRPPHPGDLWLFPFWLLTTTFVVLLATKKSWRALHGQDVLFWGTVALFPVALSASRNVAALEILMVPAVGELVELRFQRPASGFRRERQTLNGILLSAATVCAVLVVG
jgi:hypothetical protein